MEQDLEKKLQYAKLLIDVQKRQIKNLKIEIENLKNKEGILWENMYFEMEDLCRKFQEEIEVQKCEIADLKKENEKLKTNKEILIEENENVVKSLNYWKYMYRGAEGLCYKFQEQLEVKKSEISELKKENDKLKDGIKYSEEVSRSWHDMYLEELQKDI